MAKHLIHKAQLGERWDTIAYDYYGNAGLMHHIVAANLEQFATPVPLVFSSAVLIKVPVLEMAQVSGDQLPPWKRK